MTKKDFIARLVMLGWKPYSSPQGNWFYPDVKNQHNQQIIITGGDCIQLLHNYKKVYETNYFSYALEFIINWEDRV